jgi:GMP synthase (glutamine-hydrolysing)
MMQRDRPAMAGRHANAGIPRRARYDRGNRAGTLMPPPRFLVIEGNTAAGRARHQAAGGTVASEGYSALLRELVRGAEVDVAYPADSGANLPDQMALEGYDGVTITGSALHIYDGGPEVQRQIDLVRTLLGTGTPAFGSCWGLQLLMTTAGGSVRRNPKGREVGFGRAIRLTAAGREHPMYAGKADSFDAVAVHLDEVETLAPDTAVLALNAMAGVQAAEIRCGATVAWGVQYHPEYSLKELAAIVRRTGTRLVEEGFFAAEKDLIHYADELVTLDLEPANRPLAWRHGVDGAVLDRSLRVKEVANWIERMVLPTRSQRGRG